MLLLVALGILTAGCGDEDEESGLLTEDSLRECLADAGFGRDSSNSGGGYAPVYLNQAPDFSVYAEDGTRLDVIVLGSVEKAERTEADIEAALLTFGSGDVDVLRSENAVAVFDRQPSDEDRRAAESCLG